MAPNVSITIEKETDKYWLVGSNETGFCRGEDLLTALSSAAERFSKRTNAWTADEKEVLIAIAAELGKHRPVDPDLPIRSEFASLLDKLPGLVANAESWGISVDPDGSWDLDVESIQPDISTQIIKVEVEGIERLEALTEKLGAARSAADIDPEDDAA